MCSLLIQDYTTSVELCVKGLPGTENKKAYLPFCFGEVLLYLCADVLLDILI